MDDLDNPEEVVDAIHPLDTAGAATSKVSIVSYGHANGPLKRTGSEDGEQVTFSVQDTKNPPAKLRKTHTGLSSRLRKEIFAEDGARTRLDAMVEAVEAKMVEMSKVNLRANPTDEQSSQSLTSSNLIIGIMCEEGKHRSVAFAEELSRRIRPVGGWVVSVEHRDLGISSTNAEDVGSAEESTTVKAIRKSKKQREQERRKGRSSAGKFFQHHTLGDEDGG